MTASAFAPNSATPQDNPSPHPPEFIAIILACTPGSRLFPLTTSSPLDEASIQGASSGPSDEYQPKHLLPIGGVPILLRLIDSCLANGFEEILILVGASDKGLTLRTIQTMKHATPNGTSITISHTTISVITLPPDCPGSADALRHIPTIPPKSNAIVLPGDLVLEGAGMLGLLADVHRDRGGCTMLLSDVGEEDENGIPLKESAKQKKGGLARDEEEIEYVALSSSSSSSSHNRVLFKRSKIDVDEEVRDVGTSPKLVIPKHRLLSGTVGTIRTDLSDLHVYALSPWVLKLLKARTAIASLQDELLPLLVSRQFRNSGVEGAFGQKCLQDVDHREILGEVMASFSGKNNDRSRRRRPDDAIARLGSMESMERGEFQTTKYPPVPFIVSAYVLPRGQRLALRASTIPSYLYACRELVQHVLHPPNEDLVLQANPIPYRSSFQPFSAETTTMPKFNSVLLPDTQTGEKVTIKSSTIGANTKIGNKCKLNNVVVMNDVVIGDHCTLQNSVIGRDVNIGDGCSLNDVQVGNGASVASGTKLKGESVTKN